MPSILTCVSPAMLIPSVLLTPNLSILLYVRSLRSFFTFLPSISLRFPVHRDDIYRTIMATTAVTAGYTYASGAYPSIRKYKAQHTLAVIPMLAAIPIIMSSTVYITYFLFPPINLNNSLSNILFSFFLLFGLYTFRLCLPFFFQFLFMLYHLHNVRYRKYRM